MGVAPPMIPVPLILHFNSETVWARRLADVFVPATLSLDMTDTSNLLDMVVEMGGRQQHCEEVLSDIARQNETLQRRLDTAKSNHGGYRPSSAGSCPAHCLCSKRTKKRMPMSSDCGYDFGSVGHGHFEGNL
jgi:hypothetical protein